MKKRTIQILGAGPSGLSAAIVLARAGHDVQVHERYDEVGKRFQGDLQGMENWSSDENLLAQLKRYGIDVNFEATPFNKVLITDGRREFEKSSAEPLFYLVKRGTMPESLDQGLYQQALHHGVNVHFRSSPSTNIDIIATGPIRQSCVAVDKGLIFQSDLPNMAVAIFHDELAHLGYSYLLIAQGYGCLCTVVFKDFHRLNVCFDKTVNLVKQMVNLNLSNAHPVGGTGSFVLKRPLIIDQSLRVGEAAGFQDLLWGFGIRTAITSGYLAATSLLEQQSYPVLVDRHLTPYLKAGVVNRFIWEKMKWGETPLLPLFTKLPFKLKTSFGLIYRFTSLHRLLYPVALKYIKKHYPKSVR